MGALCSGPDMSPDERKQAEYENQMTKMIESAMEQDQKQDNALLKLLLLGTGESGKSTIFKQIIHLYGKASSWDTDARQPYANIVATNLVVGAKTLVEQSAALAERRPELKTALSGELVGSKNYVEQLKLDAKITPEVAKHLSALWSDPGIRNTFKHRSQFQLSDSVGYFLDHVTRIGNAPNYVPTYDDVLRCRARTTGIVETAFDIDQNKFKLVDVGGQRNERKKWIHCFEAVTAVIFVAAINEYNQVLYEDGVTNRLEEAFDLFDEICNSRWFHNTAMILFLNKKDLFEEFMLEHRINLNNCPTFRDMDPEDGLDVGASLLAVQSEFLSRNKYPDTKSVYCHVTCATDTENVSFTFNAVKDIIIKNRLKECGLLE